MTIPHEPALLSAAEAMRDAEIGYSINLTRLVDGVAEHTATLPDGSTHIFPTSAAASEFVERERNLAKAKAAVEAYLAGMGDGWIKVTTEPTLELLKSINVDNQVLAYENGRYYNAWFAFEQSEGGWFWMDEADSEPNPSHYRPLPNPPSIPSDEGSEKP